MVKYTLAVVKVPLGVAKIIYGGSVVIPWGSSIKHILWMEWSQHCCKHSFCSCFAWVTLTMQPIPTFCPCDCLSGEMVSKEFSPFCWKFFIIMAFSLSSLVPKKSYQMLCSHSHQYFEAWHMFFLNSQTPNWKVFTKLFLFQIWIISLSLLFSGRHRISDGEKQTNKMPCCIFQSESISMKVVAKAKWNILHVANMPKCRKNYHHIKSLCHVQSTWLVSSHYAFQFCAFEACSLVHVLVLSLCI